jgi:hypothetical protein
VSETVGAAAWVTETEALACEEPPAPAQVSRNVVLALMGGVDWFPLSVLLPLHPPDAVQLVALAEDQVNVAVPPAGTLDGLTESDTTGGAGAALTVTTVLAWEVPPGPEQLRTKVDVEDSEPVDCVPLVGLLPFQAFEAVQLLVPIVAHVSVEDPPAVTDEGLADIEMEGAGGDCTATVADAEVVPPAPVQLRLNAESAESAPLDCVPLVGFDPLHAPEAVHSFAAVVDQLSVVASPAVTVFGLAVIVMVGGVDPTDTVAEARAEPPGP